MGFPIIDGLRTNIGDPAGKTLADIEHAERHDEAYDALRELRNLNGVQHFVDVSRQGGNQSITTSFTTIQMGTVNSDTGGLYNPSTYIYTVPESGLYSIVGSLRAGDSQAAGIQFGVGVHTSNVDGPWFFWHAIQATTNGQRRTTYPYARVARFVQGDGLRMFSYVDGTASMGTAGMTICKIGS